MLWPGLLHAGHKQWTTPCQWLQQVSLHISTQDFSQCCFACRYNKLALDVDDSQSSSEKTEDDQTKQESGISLSPPSHAPKLSNLPPSSHVPSLEGNTQTDKKEEDSPAILSLMKDSPNAMTSSVILSSLHTRRMSAKAEGSLLGASFTKSGGLRGDVGGASSILGRRQSQGVVSKIKGMVDEVSVFTLSGSELVRSKTIAAASMGTNHTALLTSMLVTASSSDSSQFSMSNIETTGG